MTRPARVSWLESYLEGSRTLSTSLLLSVPLFAIYEAGLILTRGNLRNLADGVLKGLIQQIHPRAILVLNALLLLLFALLADRRERRGRGSAFLHLGPLFVESTVYACLLVPLGRIAHGITLLGASSPPPLDLALLLGVGAGLYEEILFRLLLLPLAYTLLHRFMGVDRFWALVSSVILSSLLFAAYHHVGPLAEPYVASAFAFRFLAGVYLGVIFCWRGFAVAVWTHVLYDEFCILSLS